MINATDNPAAATPPTTGCPNWCVREHDWEADGADFALDHESAELASPGATYSLTVFAYDWFDNGAFELGQGHAVLQLGDVVLAGEDVARLAVDMPRACELMRSTTRHKRA